MAWIVANLPTIAVSILLVAILVLLAVYLISSKKKGKYTCSCGRNGCQLKGSCHTKE